MSIQFGERPGTDFANPLSHLAEDTPMLSVAAAEAILQNLLPAFEAVTDQERVPILDASRRILAEAIASPLDFPHWDNSAMDGYAVRYEDVAQASMDAPSSLQIVEEIAAGQVPTQSIGSGQAARIFTGAMLPEGADTIVMQENTRPTTTTQISDQQMWVDVLEAPPESGHFVRHRGAFHRVGDRLLSTGQKLGPADIAVLAAAQQATVPVWRKLHIGILSTGDELVDPGAPLKAGQIVDSNRYGLAAAVEQAGAIAELLGRLPDRPEALQNAITAALKRPELDFILSSGGVSVGDHDHVDQVLEDLGATLHIRAVAVKPGKPLTVATLPRPKQEPLIYCGLPGNPVSALVSFWRFVQPTLRRRAGERDWQPRFITVPTQQPLKAGGKRETYLWGQLHWDGTGVSFAIANGSHSSGNLVNLAQTNALAKIPVGVNGIEAGQAVEVLVLA